MPNTGAAEHAEQIAENLEPWKGPFQELDKARRRQGRTILLTLASVLLDIILTIALVAGFFHLNALEKQSATNASVAYHTCVSGNSARDAERNAWNLVFGALESSATTTPAAADAEKKYQATIDKSLADRTCTNATTGKVSHG